MALISLRQLLDHAAEHGYGLPAFNVNNMEQIQAIMQAAEACDSPVILQASAGARKYAGEPFLRKLVEAAIEQYPDIPVCLHQDHGTSPAVCQQSMRSGFSSVMMDGSLGTDGKTPTSYAYNVEVTARVVDMAHVIGVSVEGELGCLGSLETGEAGEEDGIGAAGKLAHAQLLTDPDEAADFVARTGVDALAIAIGNMHGHYRGEPKLDFERLQAIHKATPCALVLHGGSGISDADFVRAIRGGIRKVNIYTAMNDYALKYLREHLNDGLSWVDLACKQRDAIEDQVTGFVKLFGCIE
jgi:fructose-bisphosphate aldolase class II